MYVCPFRLVSPFEHNKFANNKTIVHVDKLTMINKVQKAAANVGSSRMQTGTHYVLEGSSPNILINTY